MSARKKEQKMGYYLYARISIQIVRAYRPYIKRINTPFNEDTLTQNNTVRRHYMCNVHLQRQLYRQPYEKYKRKHTILT